jgi:thioredoxin-dependent peroxiredoxin
MLKKGTKAPLIKATTDQGDIFDSSTLIGKKNLVVFFFPKSNTSGCTVQACAFRDDYEVFLQHEAEVVGVSSDSIEQQRDFSGNYQFPFPLIQDRGSAIRQAFGVPKTLFLIPGRTTFVINKSGVIVHAV